MDQSTSNVHHQDGRRSKHGLLDSVVGYYFDLVKHNRTLRIRISDRLREMLPCYMTRTFTMACYHNTLNS
jgi:hypothetical protein